MKLKGNMVIELTDENTGAVETIEESNMATNVVNNLLGLNPMGIFYNVGGKYDDHVDWDGNMFPICPNMIGGIMLFSKSLTEDVDISLCGSLHRARVTERLLQWPLRQLWVVPMHTDLMQMTVHHF